VHGAALSGIHAAQELCGNSHGADAATNPAGTSTSHLQEEEKEKEEDGELLPVVVVGSGAAGLFAAATVQAIELNKRRPRPVVVLEAKERHGGRVHTVSLTSSPPPSPAVAAASSTQTPAPFSTSSDASRSSAVSTEPLSSQQRDLSVQDSQEACEGSVQVDLGASWLQQFPDNFLVDHARQLKLDLHPTDFQSALCAASDGLPLTDLHAVVEELCDVAVSKVTEAASLCSHTESSPVSDLSIIEALQPYITSLPPVEQRQAHLALSGDINSDFGYHLHNTSAKHALMELGIGNEDHFIKQGYGAILDPVARGLDIRYNSPVQSIDWSRGDHVAVTTFLGQVLRASHCLCTVPVSVLRGPALCFIPPLPPAHCRALGHIQQGKCEKVVLRFSSRWWPHSSNGLYRWYDNTQHQGPLGGEGDNTRSFPMLLNWNEWLDLTDCLGAPVVIGFCVGEEACAQFHGEDRSDAEIAQAAARAFEAWAWHRREAADDMS
jgi:hypothetical protein